MLIGFGGLTKMNNGLVRSNVEVLESLKEILHNWLEIMSDDPHFAPPAWVMESMWTSLNVVISSIASEEV